MGTKEIKRDSVIKSMDFPGRDDCYLIGIVDKIEGGMIEGVIVKRVLEGKIHSIMHGDGFMCPELGCGYVVGNRKDRIVVLDE